MQFTPQKDFIFRRATASDQAEAVALMKKYGDPTLADGFEAQFRALAQDPSAFFQVALNSNGVVFAWVYCTRDEWKELVANPNFLKKSFLDHLYEEVKNWAIAHSDGKLRLKPKLIKGDWKTFFKGQGAKIERLPGGIEQLVF